MFLRRAFSECNSEVVFGLVFVPFGWPFSLPLISVLQRNPSRVLKFFCLSNRLCFCGGMCLAMCFSSLRFAIFWSCFIAAWRLLRFYFYCAFFCAEIASLSAIFFAVTSTLKGRKCWQTRCFPTLKNNFLRVNSLFCDEGLAWRLRSSKNCFERSRSWFFCSRIVRKLLLPSVAWAAFYARCRLTA